MRHSGAPTSHEYVQKSQLPTTDTHIQLDQTEYTSLHITSSDAHNCPLPRPLPLPSLKPAHQRKDSSSANLAFQINSDFTKCLRTVSNISPVHNDDHSDKNSLLQQRIQKKTSSLEKNDGDDGDIPPHQRIYKQTSPSDAWELLGLSSDGFAQKDEWGLLRPSDRFYFDGTKLMKKFSNSVDYRFDDPGNAFNFKSTAPSSPRQNYQNTPTIISSSVIYKEMAFRTILRTVTYCCYDILGHLGLKDSARVAKIMVESIIDECIPPVPFNKRSQENHNISKLKIITKLLEYLLPCGFSSLLLWNIKNSYSTGYLKLNDRRAPSKKPSCYTAWYPIAYRLVRQAIIYRLFFPIGTLPYWLVTIVALICSFFTEDCIKDLFRITLWVNHLDINQGVTALIRSAAYAAVFTMPFDQLFNNASAKFEKFFASAQHKSKIRKRINNLKRLIFFLGCILTTRLASFMEKRKYSAYPIGVKW